MEQPLRIMWDAQEALIHRYVENKKQEDWPISLEDKKGQAFVRELFGFLEEEIFEAYELVELMGITLAEVNPIAIGKDEVEKHLKNFNEEIADTLAFWIEIFMYVGYDEHVLGDYYSVMMEQMDLKHLHQKDDILSSALKFAQFIVSTKYMTTHETLKAGCHNLILTNKMDMLEFGDFKAGNFVSAKIVNYSQHYIFHCLKHLNIATNCLKMKYWREEKNAPNYDKFHSNLMEAWLNYIVFLYLLGYDSSQQIKLIYLMKNEKNIERINSKW